MIGLLIRRSLANHWFSSLVTALSVALATGLLMTVVALNAQAFNAFTAGEPGFDAVLGARGSQLQLVLNAVFLMETSPGNLPWSAYEAVAKNPQVKRAVPYAVGDSYHGFPVVGTTLSRFEALPDYASFKVAWPQNSRTAVVGATVAEEVGLQDGSTFHPEHGAHGHEHSEGFLVREVLRRTGTPLDRAIFVPLEDIWAMEGHTHAHEVSGVLLQLTSPQAGMQLTQHFNREGHVATLAWPIGTSMATLFEQLGWVHQVLELVCALVVLVACASIMASLTSALAARRQEFAVLRALGAHQRTLLGLITGESAAIAAIGSLVGLFVYACLMNGATYVIWQRTGVTLNPLAWHPVFGLAPLGVTLLGALSGLPAAISAYSTEAAAHL